MTTKTRAKKGLASQTPHFLDSQAVSPPNALRGLNTKTLDAETAKSNYIKQFIDNEEEIHTGNQSGAHLYYQSPQPNREVIKTCNSSSPGSLWLKSKTRSGLPRLVAEPSGLERRYMDYGLEQQEPSQVGGDASRTETLSYYVDRSSIASIPTVPAPGRIQRRATTDGDSNITVPFEPSSVEYNGIGHSLLVGQQQEQQQQPPKKPSRFASSEQEYTTQQSMEDADAVARRLIARLQRAGYRYQGFAWLPESTECRVEGSTIARNPNGQWRAVQGDLQMETTGKYYIRLEVDFAVGDRGTHKYFGIAPKLIGGEDRKKHGGVYFGCGRGRAQRPNRSSKNGTNDEEVTERGVFLYIDGIERQVLDLTLRPKDEIGIRFDADLGMVSFDLNNLDTGVAYEDDSLKMGSFFPTVWLGHAGDSVRILGPAPTFLDPNSRQPLFATATLRLLKQVEQVRKQQNKQPESQQALVRQMMDQMLNNGVTAQQLIDDVAWAAVRNGNQHRKDIKAEEQTLGGEQQNEACEPLFLAADKVSQVRPEAAGNELTAEALVHREQAQPDSSAFLTNDGEAVISPSCAPQLPKEAAEQHSKVKVKTDLPFTENLLHDTNDHSQKSAEAKGGSDLKISSSDAPSTPKLQPIIEKLSDCELKKEKNNVEFEAQSVEEQQRSLRSKSENLEETKEQHSSDAQAPYVEVQTRLSVQTLSGYKVDQNYATSITTDTVERESEVIESQSVIDLHRLQSSLNEYGLAGGQVRGEPQTESQSRSLHLEIATLCEQQLETLQHPQASPVPGHTGSAQSRSIRQTPAQSSCSGSTQSQFTCKDQQYPLQLEQEVPSGAQSTATVTDMDEYGIPRHPAQSIAQEVHVDDHSEISGSYRLGKGFDLRIVEEPARGKRGKATRKTRQPYNRQSSALPADTSRTVTSDVVVEAPQNHAIIPTPSAVIDASTALCQPPTLPTTQISPADHLDQAQAPHSASQRLQLDSIASSQLAITPLPRSPTNMKKEDFQDHIKFNDSPRLGTNDLSFQEPNQPSPEGTAALSTPSLSPGHQPQIQRAASPAADAEIEAFLLFRQQLRRN